jgi:hypothetical protein
MQHSTYQLCSQFLHCTYSQKAQKTLGPCWKTSGSQKVTHSGSLSKKQIVHWCRGKMCA